MASVGYQVVVARLMENGVDNPAIKAEFNQQYGTLMKIIRTAYTANMITDIKSLDLRTIFRPKVILLVTDEITKHANIQYRPKLARFVETGGTLILCCWFVSRSTAWGIDGILWEFKQCQWTVAEGPEAFIRTDLALNRATAMKKKFGDESFSFLKDTYSMQAVSLKGVAMNDQVYRQVPAVEALEEFADATPSAFHKHGHGYLGYVGDTKLEEGTKALIMAMLEASISPLNPSNNNQPSIPNKPHPNSQGKLSPPRSAARPTPQKPLSDARFPKPAQTQESTGFKTTMAGGNDKKGSPTEKTGARPSLQTVSPDSHPSSPPRLPAMNTSTKILLMQNGSPIITSMNAIAEESPAAYRLRTTLQRLRSDGSNTDTVVHGGGHPMHSVHNLAAHPTVPNILISYNSDRTKATLPDSQPSPMSRMTSQPKTSDNHTIAKAAGGIGPYEAVPQSPKKDSINVSAEPKSSQAVEESRFSQSARQSPITLPSLKPVARNDITALHQFKKASSNVSTGEDSYGGGLTIPSVHTDLSGPPSCNSRSENVQLANTWDAEVNERSDCNNNEIPVYGENGKNNGEISACIPDDHTHASNQASISKHVSDTGGSPTHQNKHDEDDLYEASITAAESKTFKAKAEIQAHQTPATIKNTPTDAKPTDQTKNAIRTLHSKKNRTSKPKISKIPQMPNLAPCNPGCAVCTILLPAKKCTGCRRVQYCSAACQKADWKEHKAVCGLEPSIRKSEERVNGGIEELMCDSQSEDFEYGEDAVDGEEDLDV